MHDQKLEQPTDENQQGHNDDPAVPAERPLRAYGMDTESDDEDECDDDRDHDEHAHSHW